MAENILLKTRYSNLPDINDLSEYGLAPLHAAVINGKISRLEELLKLGAKPDVKSGESESVCTALGMAIDNLHVEMVKILLDYNASVKDIDRYQNSAIWCTITTRIEGIDLFETNLADEQIAILDLIFQQGFKSKNISEVNYFKLCKAIVDRNVRAIRRLVDRCEDVNYVSIGAESPLEIAVYLNDLETVRLLLKKGANPNPNLNLCNLKKMTPLYRATELDNVELMKLLLDHAAEVDAPSPGARRPLHEACGQGMLDGVKLLVNHSADVNSYDDIKRTPLTSALHNPEIMRFLLKRGAEVNSKNYVDWPSLKIACLLNCSLDCVKVLIKYGADLTTLSYDGQTILHFLAGQTENLEVIRYLVRLIIDHQQVNINTEDMFGTTPLMCVNYCTSDSSSCIIFLEFMKMGADLNASDIWDCYADHQCLNNIEKCATNEYVQRLKFLGYQIEGDRFQYLGEDLSENYRQELNEMKSEVISWIPRKTLYDVLFMERCSLLQFRKNKNLRKIFAECDNDFESKYRYFGSILNLKYRQKKYIQSLSNSVRRNLHKVLGAAVPEECSGIIFRYSNNHQLKKFAEEKFEKFS